MTPPTLTRSELDKLKATVDLVALFESHGVAVRKIGRSLKALCPFHEEKTPSLSIDAKKGVYHCFGCGQSGDHLTFLQSHLKLGFAEAISALQQAATATTQPAQITQEEKEPPFPYDLVARVAEIWHQAFCEQSDGLAYLEQRGLRDRALLRDLKTGYCDGEKLLAITNAEERQLLQRVGILNDQGKEFFSRCVVFPLRDRHDRVVGFYGRSVIANAKVPHRYCAGTRAGLFHRQAVHGVSSVHLVEGILDALALHQAGFANTMALGGVQGLSETLVQHLRGQKVREIVLCLDGDQAGRNASGALETQLQKEGFAVRAVQLPEKKDPLSCTVSELQSFLKAQATMEKANRYRKLSASGGKLKVLVSMQNEAQEQAEATVDLYSSRSRKQEAIGLARRLGLEVDEIENWFFQILRELEAQRGSAEESQSLFANVEIPPMSEKHRQESLGFLSQPNLIDAILADMEALGYVGEPEAKLLGYCVSVSRKLERPMSAILQSGSGAGKSYLAETIQALTPPEDVVFYSRLSQQALYHMPKDYLCHKLLCLEERMGGEACDYQIRALQSSNKLVQAIVVKDPNTGQLFTKENEVLGPIAYLETTTSLRLNPENTSRCFEIPLDESAEQTRRIFERQKALKGLERLSVCDHREKLQEKHHNAQRLLENVPVVIPFANLLTFPDQWLRARRDHDRFLHLIEVLAYLHQFQRPRHLHECVEYIEATTTDYRWAYFLASRVLRNSLDEVSRWARELLTYFECEDPPLLTRRELRDVLKWPDRRLREALEELVDLEYLECQRGANNLFMFRLAGPAGGGQKLLGLLTPEELERQWP